MAEKIKIGGELDPRTPEKILGDASTIKDRTWETNHGDVAQTPNQKQDEINEYFQDQIDNIVATEQGGIQTDAAPTEGSVKLVQSGGTYTTIQNAVTAAKTFSTGETVPTTGIDTNPTNNSTNLVKSGGVKTAIDNVAFSTNEKVKNVGIDDEPTAGSENLVKSGGVHEEISQVKQETFGSIVNSPNNTHIPFKLYSGKSYIFTNNSETTCNIYVRITQSSTNQVFVGGVAVGSSVIFNPETDFNYLYFYKDSSETYSVNIKYRNNLLDEVKYLESEVSDLDLDVSDIYSELITGAIITLSGTETSNLVLNEPIVLSEDGDEIEIFVDNISSSNGNGLSFSNAGVPGNPYAIQLSQEYVGIRAVDKTWLHQSIRIPTSTSHIVKISFSNGNILTYVDNVLVNTYTGQKDISIASFGNGGAGTYGYWAGTINYIKYNSQDINLYLQQINNAIVIKQYRFAPASEENYPKGILKYDATNKQFDFYSRFGDSNKYFMFRVRLDTDDTDLVYLKEWRWSYGKYCEYNGSTFTDVATTAIDAENEMAMKFKDTIDYTGGIHGDERIDVSLDSFVKFFADGRLISDSEMLEDFAIECASFAYIQLSSLHQTSTVEGEFVAGHPIIAMHYKRNTFENCQSHLENRIIFTSEQYVTQYHAGLMCVGKGTATYASLPNAVMTPQLTGTNDLYDADNKKVPRVDMWNPTNGIRCYVEGKMIEGIAESDINVLQVWDRITDSKYYRRMVVSGSNAKVFQEDDVIINEQNVVYY